MALAPRRTLLAIQRHAAGERVRSMASILIVDDSPTVVHATSRTLAAAGYEILSASDGEEGLRLALEHHPGLVLLDVILPKINGYEVCRRLKAAPETAHLPVIMLTSKTKERDRYWGLEQGADDYITKPFTTEKLLEVARRFVPEADVPQTEG
jgi:twitching motility two-component system response regulator PilH